MTRVALLSFHTCPLAPLGTRYAGGMNVHVLNLARELGRLGVAVDVYSRAHLGLEGMVVPLGDNSRLIHIRAGPAATSGEALFQYPPAFVQGVRLFGESQGIHYDLVHSHFWLAAWAGNRLARHWGLPHVVTFHTLAEVKLRAHPAQRESELRLREESQAVSSADRIVAFSLHERAMLLRHYGVALEKTTVVPCGVDQALFQPRDRLQARDKVGLDPKDRVIIFVGRVDPLKGLELLLESLACLEDRDGLRVLVVGGGSVRDKALKPLRTRVGDLGLKRVVRFIGAVGQVEMPFYYSAADLCVMPSYHESFGLVALEAMACGVPVVAARVGGLQTLVRHGETGYLVDGHRPEAYVAPIEALLYNQALGRSMGEVARAWAQSMSWPQVARHMEALYREVLNSPRGLPVP